MDADRFDTLTRLVATSRTRRQLLRTLGGGAFAALGALIGAAQGSSASPCPSGVICAAHCCPDDETCVFGRCRPASSLGSPGPNPGPCQPATACPPGQTCGTADDGCGGTLRCGTCDAPYVCNTDDNPPPNCACEDFQTVCDGKCGQFNDTCGNPVDCGGCDSGCCHSDNTCRPPDCAGKVCGDDGCGGSCGASGPGESCERSLRLHQHRQLLSDAERNHLQRRKLLSGQYWRLLPDWPGR